MSEKKNRLSFMFCFLFGCIAPMTISIIVLTVLTGLNYSKTLVNNSFEKLHSGAISVKEYFEWDINEDILEKDEVSYQFIDSMKKLDIDFALYEKDVSWMSSIKDASQSRLEDKRCDSSIWSVVKAGEDYYEKDVDINGTEYYVYYTPIRDVNGSVWGMAFAGEPAETVNHNIRSILFQLILGAIIVEAFCSLIAVIVALKIVRPIKASIDEISELSEGNLDVSIDAKSHIADIKKLIGSTTVLKATLIKIVSEINDSVDDLNINCENINESISVCNDATGGIAEAMVELTSGATETADSLQFTASNVTEIGDGIETISHLSIQTNDNAESIREVAKQTQAKLNALLEANEATYLTANEVHQGIVNSSEAISKISKATEMITGIAKQTNLLSLNASIEAARAGEAGRGFAVVAGDIRTLADQSDASAKEIRIIVEEIIGASNNNKNLAKRITESVQNENEVLLSVNDNFKVVSESINDITNNINDINSKVSVVDNNKNKVVDEITTLSSIAEENAASCEETNASCEELRANVENINEQANLIVDVAKTLKQEIEYFKIGERNEED